MAGCLMQELKQYWSYIIEGTDAGMIETCLVEGVKTKTQE